MCRKAHKHTQEMHKSFTPAIPETSDDTARGNSWDPAHGWAFGNEFYTTAGQQRQSPEAQQWGGEGPGSHAGHTQPREDTEGKV